MTATSDALDEIDSERIMRARELSEMKVRLAIRAPYGKFDVESKAVVVLAYAHWEGFYNSCVDTYLGLLQRLGKRVQDVEWSMLAGALTNQLRSLQDRNSSPEALNEFIEALKVRLLSDFNDFDDVVVKSRSNLNFERLRSSYRVLGFDIAEFQRFRIRIDKELVSWRHSVAHGSSPNLTAMDKIQHINFSSELLLALADQFQKEIVSRF